MAIFPQGNSATQASYGPPAFTGVTFQTSAQAIPIPVMWGTRRISPNVIWQGNTLSIAPPASVVSGVLVGPIFSIDGPDVGNPGWLRSSSSFPGHFALDPRGFAAYGALAIGTGDLAVGGPYGDFAAAYPPDGTAHWWVPAVMALCEGPINGITRIWNGGNGAAIPNVFPFQYVQETVFTGVFNALVTPCLFYTVLVGSSTQNAWPYFAAANAQATNPNYPLLAYRLTACLASALFDYGTDGSRPPDQSFEVQRTPIPADAFSDSYQLGVDYLLSDVILDLFQNPQYGIGISSSMVDSASLTTWRNYLLAQGLFHSPLLDSQSAVTDIIDRFAAESNTLIFWDGSAVHFVPLGDETLTANGATYTPDVTPAYNLGLGDFLDEGLQIDRADPIDCNNRVRIEISDRSSDYSKVPIEWKDAYLIQQFGVRDASSIDGQDICDVVVGAKVVELFGKRMAYVRNMFSFTLSYRYILLLPGSIVTLTDPNLGLNLYQVRILTIDEDTNGNLACTAEEYPGTLGLSRPVPTQAWTPANGASGGSGTSGSSSSSGSGSGTGTPIVSSGGTMTVPPSGPVWGFVVAGDIVILPAVPIVGVTYEFTHDQQRVPQPTPAQLEDNPVTFFASVTPVSGVTASVTNGSASITFSASQTLAAGTPIVFASQSSVTYTLSGPVSGTSGTLTANYTGTTNAATAIFIGPSWLFENPQDRTAAPAHTAQWLVSGGTIGWRFDGTVMRCVN